MKDYNRYDMSEWVIHFVHDRQSKDDLYALREICKLEEPDVEYRIPTYYDKRKRPHDLTDEHSDDEWWIGEDAPAFDVLQKIIHDGYIRSGWSLRDFTPTIFGPYSAVCFTEMPLYAEKYALMNNLRIVLLASGEDIYLYGRKIGELYSFEDDEGRDLQLEYKKSAFVYKEMS